MNLKFLKFCVVGGSGAILTFGITWTLTEWIHLWYMASMVIAVGIATVSNYTLNANWTFRETKIKPDDPEYDWYSFYNGNVIQKWWKRGVANAVWEFIPNSSILLDVGCGSSPMISKYSKAVGIDANPQKMGFMKSKLPDCDFYVMDARRINFPNQKFDYVICTELLEHIPEPEAVVKEIARVVKVDGKVVLATPDYGRWWWYFAELFTAYKEAHVTKFTRERLENMCIKNGLEPIQHKYVAGCDLVEEFTRVV